MSRGLREAMRQDRATTLLDVADALLQDEILEMHWLAYDLLERAIVSEPERAWQRLRVEASRAGDWITVDSLAHVAGRGILSEPYRWAELEQLVYSPVALGAPARRLHDRDHPPRRPPRGSRARRRRPRPPDPRAT